MSHTLVELSIDNPRANTRGNPAAWKIKSHVLTISSILFLLLSHFVFKFSPGGRLLVDVFFAGSLFVSLTYLGSICVQEKVSRTTFRIDSSGLFITAKGKMREHRWSEIVAADLVDIALPGEGRPQPRLQLKTQSANMYTASSDTLPLSGELLQNLTPVIQAAIQQWGARPPARKLQEQMAA